MNIKKSVRIKYLIHILIMIILAPSGLALGTGVGFLDMGIEAISRLFNIQSLQENGYIQEGFLKFALFIVIFAVSNASLKKVKGIFDKKTAGVVAFSFSMIGVFMMPTEWLLATGGLVTAVMSSLIFLGFFWGLAVVSVFVLRKKGEDDKMGWIKNLLGLILIFILLTLLDDWALFVGISIEGAVGGTFVIRAYGTIISWTYVLLTILIIVKIFQFTAFTSGEYEWKWPWQKDGFKEPPRPKPDKEPEEPEKEPEEPPDFDSPLSQFQALLNNYDSSFRQFKESCNDVLKTHYEFMNSIGGYTPPKPPVSPEQWQKVNERLKNLNSIADSINDLISKLTNHSDYRKMKPAQQTRFASLSGIWANYLPKTNTFRKDFINRYTKTMLPAP
jgi:hypothetical protein